MIIISIKNLMLLPGGELNLDCWALLRLDSNPFKTIPYLTLSIASKMLISDSKFHVESITGKSVQMV